MALGADISARHLSFLETGRAKPSRDMVLRLAERVDAPLRERNRLLLAAGFAPLYGDRPLEDEALAPARDAIDAWLAAHEPFPALAVDRLWNLVAANGALAPLLTGVDAALLAPPTNVLRLTLHPGGLADRIENLAEWRAHLLERLRRQSESTGDLELAALRAELAAYPAPSAPRAAASWDGVFHRLVLRAGDARLSFISTTTVFGTAAEVSVSELMLEVLLPADHPTRAWFTRPS